MTLSKDNRFLRMTIEKALKDLPAIPAVIHRVLLEIEKPGACAATLEKMVLTDQALAVKVLRVVNSAYYGLSGQVASVSQAIVILGMQQMRNLVLSVAAVASLKPKSPRQAAIHAQFWKHSFGSATAAQIIAKEIGLPPKDAELVLIGGLLHDIGRLFLFVNFTDVYSDLLLYAAKRNVTIEEAEQSFLGMTHAQIGETMARTWRLPEALVSMIANHAGPFAETSASSDMVVHLADCATRYLYYPPQARELVKMDPYARHWWGVSEDEIARIQAMVEKKVDETAATLGFDVAA